MALNDKQRVFVEEYLRCWNATEAARRAEYANPNKQGPRLLVKDGICNAIKARIDEKAMSADEVLVRLAEQARADLSVFFKPVEEWTFFPLPSYDIIDVKEVVDDSDPDNPIKRVSYWVRHIALDMDKLIDPHYSHLLKKFSDSPKSGLSVELYDAQAALVQIGKHHGIFREHLEVTGRDGRPLALTVETDLSGLSDEQLRSTLAKLGGLAAAIADGGSVSADAASAARDDQASEGSGKTDA